MSRLTPVVETDYRHAHRSAVEYPRAVVPRHEDIAALLNALQDPLVGAAADRIGRQQSRAPDIAVRYQRACPLEPVAHQVGATGDVPRIQGPQVLDVSVPQFAS